MILSFGRFYLFLSAAVMLAAYASAAPSNSSTTRTNAHTVSEMTPEQLARGIVTLALSMQEEPHITPAMIEKALGGPIEFGTAESQLFGKVGELTVGGRYEAVTVPSIGPPQRFDIDFKPEDASDDAVCVQSIGIYHGMLTDAGFTPTWIVAPRLGSRALWHFRRGDIDILAFVGKNATKDAVSACVVGFDISKVT